MESSFSRKVNVPDLLIKYFLHDVWAKQRGYLPNCTNSTSPTMRLRSRRKYLLLFQSGKFLTSISSSLREQVKSFVDRELAQIADPGVSALPHSPANQKSPSRSSFLTIRSSTKSSALRRANFSLVRVSTRMLLRIPSMLV